QVVVYAPRRAGAVTPARATVTALDQRERRLALLQEVPGDGDHVAHHRGGVGEHRRIESLQEIARPTGGDEKGIVDVTRRVGRHGDDRAGDVERGGGRLGAFHGPSALNRAAFGAAHRLRITTDAL